jgi:hypothetical protein
VCPPNIPYRQRSPDSCFNAIAKQSCCTGHDPQIFWACLYALSDGCSGKKMFLGRFLQAAWLRQSLSFLGIVPFSLWLFSFCFACFVLMANARAVVMYPLRPGFYRGL